MADYKESTISGTAWQRAHRVIISNPYGGTPSIVFAEEQATNLNGVVTTTPVAEVSCVFDVTNPDHAAIYTALNNLYMQLATDRDSKEATVYVDPAPQPDTEVF